MEARPAPRPCREATAEAACLRLERRAPSAGLEIASRYGGRGYANRERGIGRTCRRRPSRARASASLGIVVGRPQVVLAPCDTGQAPFSAGARSLRSPDRAGRVRPSSRRRPSIRWPRTYQKRQIQPGEPQLRVSRLPPSRTSEMQLVGCRARCRTAPNQRAYVLVFDVDNGSTRLGQLQEVPCMSPFSEARPQLPSSSSRSAAYCRTVSSRR